MHREVAMWRLDTGSRIDPVDGASRTPLHHTSRSDELFNMTLLLSDRGTDFEFEDVIGFRPLHYSCTFGQTLTTMKHETDGPWRRCVGCGQVQLESH